MWAFHAAIVSLSLASWALAAPPLTSSLLSSKTLCNILVKSGSANIGYISPIWNEYGQYGALQPSKTNALQVQITYELLSPSKRLSITSVNGPDGRFPMFGAAMGFSTDGTEMKPGNSNYAYITGVTQPSTGASNTTASNSFTDKTTFDVSSFGTIWIYKPLTGSLVVQWVNSDSKPVDMRILYAQDEKTLFITGDPAAFSAAVGVSYPEVTFTCVR